MMYTDLLTLTLSALFLGLERCVLLTLARASFCSSDVAIRWAANTPVAQCTTQLD